MIEIPVLGQVDWQIPLVASIDAALDFLQAESDRHTARLITLEHPVNDDILPRQA